MRKSRLDPNAHLADGKTTLLVPPWPRWAYVETPQSTMYLYWSKGVSEDLFPLAQGFSMTVYNLRTELATGTLPCLSHVVNVYLRFLVTVPESARPSVIEEINEGHLRAFQAEMEKSPQERIMRSKANLENGARLVSQLKGLVADAWRLGVAHGAIRPNLGRHGFRNIPVSSRRTRSRKTYSEREFRLILRFLLSRRNVARGGTVKEERAYLSTCVCVLHIYLPMNLSSAFLLNEGSLRRTESDQKYDVLSVLKKRPKDSVNVLPEPKPEEFESEDLLVERGVSQVRKIFEENIAFNASNPGRSDESALFQVLYPKSRMEHRPVHGRFNQAAYGTGMETLNEEFDELGDDGNPLLIGTKKLRATFENRLPDSMSMRRKADLMHHKSEETTGSDYEAVTDVEHLRFHRGLKAIGVSVRGDKGEALAWVRETGLPIETLERLKIGMLATKSASCTDPLSAQFAPKNGAVCPSSLACFGCNALAATASDLYRLASLERRLKIDIKSGLLQGKAVAGVKFVLQVIETEIFPAFEKRKVQAARKKAEKELHPIWRRAIVESF